ncbi:TlpA family protein disulfide reductase [Luteimonas sp. BDR2-5]|uniref:TlpA disulfide reductase family protein n=1 Tax=Proluteimonas luteida TaxID=2878685 RepID=UPI001E56B3D9|nr:TlpA disulfide reductase family protein [Luteimonas sp. BDR2-5]MCD9027068.1 TlpA family protein disulfide reductase [Luteimonas sp. BDR2-5]
MTSLLLAIVLAAGSGWVQAAAGSKAPPAVGSMPPNTIGKDNAGNPVDLDALHGKVVIVTFWALWCPPCRQELPVLGHFQQVVGRDALEVVAVNFKEPRRDFVNLVRRNRDIDLTWVHDARGTLAAQYGVESLPHMFMLDREGRVAFTHRGYSEAALPGIIDEVLSLLPDEVKARPAAAPPR